MNIMFAALFTQSWRKTQVSVISLNFLGFFYGPARPLLELLLFNRNSMAIVKMTNKIIRDDVNSGV